MPNLRPSEMFEEKGIPIMGRNVGTASPASSHFMFLSSRNIITHTITRAGLVNGFIPPVKSATILTVGVKKRTIQTRPAVFKSKNSLNDFFS